MDDIINVKNKLNKVPSAGEYNSIGRFHSVTVKKKIGVRSWEDVLEKAFKIKKKRVYNIYKCLVCELPMKSYYHRKHCSPECRKKDNEFILICETCNEKFLRPKGNKLLAKSKYCSAECYQKRSKPLIK